MRVVVYPHVLELGGSQYNAIELAAAVRDLGHEVVVFGQPGPLTRRIAELDLEFVAAPRPRGRPWLPIMHALDRLVSARGIDVVHGYEWTTALEAYFGPRTRRGVPAVATVMSMSVAPFIPLDMPLVVGTEQIAAHERELGRGLVSVIEPPVDTVHNAPGAADGAAFAREHGLDADAITVVCVQRLVAELKLEGLLAAVEAAGRLAGRVPIQLVVVGDGVSRGLLEERAGAVNAAAGRRVVVLTGELHDPRPAYAAADIALGMGGSALRAMSFGTPLVVQGEQGFWELLTPDTEAQFLWTGWYGIGAGAEEGADRLEAILGPLAEDAGRRAVLGARSRDLVEERFSLRHAADVQLDLYERALAGRPLRRRASLAPGGTAAARLVAHRSRRRLDDLRGRASADDFNARPVAALRSSPPS